MIDLYTYATPNGRKVSIMLEETGLPYEVHVVDITKGEQHAPDFRAITPNGKIPAIIDPEGPEGVPFALWESGAILLYLAEKAGMLVPEGTPERHRMMQWLMFQMGNLGPMFGQAFHFLHAADEDVPYARARYTGEVERLYGVLEERLSVTGYLGGAAYTVADIATYPWVCTHKRLGVDVEAYPSVRRWLDTVKARPAVQRGMSVPEV